MEQNFAIPDLGELLPPARILVSILLLLITGLVLRSLRWACSIAAGRFMRYRLQISRVYPILRLVVWVTAFYVVLVVVIRPPIDTLIAVTASAGLALGLAAQDLVKNILSGIVLLFDQPFQVGDMVRVGDHYGEVVHIGLRSIRIHTFDDSTVTVPNALVVGQAVSNSNSGALDEMVVVEFSLPATVDVQKVKGLAWEAAASSPYVYLKKPITVLVEDAFDRTFLSRFKIKCYVTDVRLEKVLASDVVERIKDTVVSRNLLDESMVLALLHAKA